MFGSLEQYHKKNKYKSRIPGIFVFIVTYLIILSMVDHKERRFYAPVAQLGCFAQGYTYSQLWKFKKFRPLMKLILVTLMTIDGVKFFFAIKFFGGTYHSMLEPYLLFNDRYDKIRDLN